MSRKYKFHNPDGLYFVSFAVINWIDVFIREEYFEIIIENLNFYSKKGMEIFCWCIMPSHLHLIFRDESKRPEIILGRFKSFTSKSIRKAIAENPKESKKEWILWMMKRAGDNTSNVSEYMFWQHNNHPIEIWRKKIIEQKFYYIHNNPVKAGFVDEPADWKYSSAKDYERGRTGLVEMSFLW